VHGRWLRIAVVALLLIGTAALSAGNASAAPAPTCSVILPAPGQVSGTVTLDADAQNAGSVEFYANGADLGPAKGTIYGWLYTPDGGQTFGWDTAGIANGSVALTCVARGSTDSQVATSAPVNVTVNNPGGCSIVIPSAGGAVSGTRYALDAGAPSGTTTVTFHLHSATIADVVLGQGFPTIYGWIFSPNGGQTLGWDSTQYADGNYSFTCESAQSGNPNNSSPAVAASLTNGTALVNVYGRPGSFGTLANPAASGESLVTNPVPNFRFAPGRQNWFGSVAGDGTVVMGNLDQAGNYIFQSSADTTLSTFQPSTQMFQNVNVLTSTGQRSVVRSDGAPVGASISDVQALAGGNAVAFISPVTYENQNAATDGVWPAFGILTKVNGQWKVASGAGWTNQWTGAQLAATNPTDGARACPPDDTDPTVSICRAPNEMALFPQSHDIVITQYFADPSAGVMVLHVTGPDASGKYTTTLKSVFSLPGRLQPDPATPSDPNSYVDLAPLSVQTDPSSAAGDERFLVNYDQYGHDADGSNAQHPRVFEELSYNSTTGAIHETVAPTITGDRNTNGHFWHNIGGAYDNQGNLFVGRGDVFAGGAIGVYAKTASGRKLGSAACPFDPNANIGSYTTTAGGLTVWGETCKPDYDILQTNTMLVYGLSVDPATNTVAVVAGGPRIVAIRHTGSGASMTFTQGDVVDGGAGLIPSSGPRTYINAGFDGSGRLWAPLAQTVSSPNNPNYQTVDQYLYSFDVGRLFTPDRTPLENVPNTPTIQQAEETSTTATTKRTGAWATTDVEANAFVRGCITFLSETCSNDGVNGDGFYMSSSASAGVQHTLTYKIKVPSAGSYQVTFRTRTPSGTHAGVIRLNAAGTNFDTPVDTGGSWATVTGPTVSLAAGNQNVTVTPPAGGSSWDLNFLTLTRQ
jgi:hypothetical protein